MRVSAFLLYGIGRGGKIREKLAKSSKTKDKDPNAIKPLYATVSCQFLRPRVRATPYCEGVRCAMKTQQRNTKHTPFDAWDLCLRLRKLCRKLSIFGDYLVNSSASASSSSIFVSFMALLIWIPASSSVRFLLSSSIFFIMRVAVGAQVPFSIKATVRF